jgi:hypothetical protein
VQAFDPDLPLRDIVTLDDQLALSRWPLRVFGSMFAIFAGALLLAVIGLVLGLSASPEYSKPFW